MSIETQEENRMGTAKMFPLILSMSLPAMFSMLIQALYNIVDSYFVAQVSEKAVSALSLAYPIQNLLIAFAVGTAAVLHLCFHEDLDRDAEKKQN